MLAYDRFVKELSDKPLIGDGLNSFSSYLHIPNIVLLGDPGAGKTFLFREYANVEQGEILVARTFINISNDYLSEKSILYIDALDERRAAHGDQNAVDEIVKKIYLTKPKRIRISCRVADWLGEADLAAFRDYFERTGGYVVLSLQPLTKQEQIYLLANYGVVDSEEFLLKASEKGLEELLGNPQNLKMLADVVEKRGWPTTRFELFQQAIQILLDEHSDPQRRRQSGRYLSSELQEVAGRLCAIRLIGDILAIGLSEHEVSDEVPSYRSLCPNEIERSFSALGRRLFVAGPLSETVDYAHRTLAEFLGALWLAEKVRNGLPLGRVRSLIGINGRPASELRGLHSWLAIHLQEYGETLIDADPVGVLTYADARALSPRLRQHILKALAKLSTTDPWFWNRNSSNAAIAGLIGPDMVAAYQSILNNGETNFSLRMLVLDSLMYGDVPVELTAELSSLTLSRHASYVERKASVNALLRIQLVGKTEVVKIYKELGNDEDELQLRAVILSEIYGYELGGEDFIQLFHDVLMSDAELPIGAFWNIAEIVPNENVCMVLDGLAKPSTHKYQKHERKEINEVLREFDKLLIRALAIDPDIQGCRLISWLEFRHELADHYYSAGNADELKANFLQNSKIVSRSIEAFLATIDINKNIWRLVHEVRTLFLGGINNSIFLEKAISALNKEENDDKKSLFYELALVLTFQIGPTVRFIFERLFNYANGNTKLEAIRLASSVYEIPDWQLEEAKRKKQHKEERESGRTKNRLAFEAHKEAILNGQNFGWLEWISRVYYPIFSNVNREVQPRERIAEEIGEENVEIAINGMIALVLHGEIPSSDEIIRMHSENKYYPWWYAIIGGLDEYIDKEQKIDNIKEEYLYSALTIECLFPTFKHKGNTSYEQEHSWKSFLLQKKPELFIAAYLKISRACLQKGSSYIYGLHTLLKEEALQHCRSHIAIKLLREFPGMHSQPLRELLQSAIEVCQRNQILDLIRSVIKSDQYNKEAESLWKAALFLASPNEYQLELKDDEDDFNKKLFWSLRDLSNFARFQHEGKAGISIEKVEQVLLLNFRLFQRTSHPVGGWSGDTNSWDATEYALRLISDLSASTDQAAVNLLRKLLNNPLSQSYVQDIKHALAQQHVRMIDAEYKQPSWKNTVIALGNGVPVGIGDLHTLIVEHLNEIQLQISAANVDIFKRFWNEDSYGRITNPKSEESCRDYLVELLRVRTINQRILIEPEGHMAADKRADIVALNPGMKLVIELKRDCHSEVWTAIQNQLERLYTRDPEAQGYGIYGVFWFGSKRIQSIPTPPLGLEHPQTAEEMQSHLEKLISPNQRNKISVVVLDVSGHIP